MRAGLSGRGRLGHFSTLKLSRPSQRLLPVRRGRREAKNVFGLGRHECVPRRVVVSLQVVFFPLRLNTTTNCSKSTREIFDRISAGPVISKPCGSAGGAFVCECEF